MDLDDNNGGLALLPKVFDNIYCYIDILGGRLVWSMNPAQHDPDTEYKLAEYHDPW